MSKVLLRGKILNLPNILALSRVIVLPYFLVFLQAKNVPMVLLLLLFMILTDILDGFLARLIGISSDIGRVFDHLADKAVLLSTIFVMTYVYFVPFWVFILFLFRELITILYSVFYFLRKKTIPGSIFAGKFNGLFLILTFLSFLFELPFRYVLLYLSLASSLLTSLYYLKIRMMDV